MKILLPLLAVAGLSGCAVYPEPGYGTYAPGYQVAVPVQPSISIYGGTRYGGARPYRPGARDQDRDGIPNRFDRDRDGDGVTNRADRRPYDPRRN